MFNNEIHECSICMCTLEDNDIIIKLCPHRFCKTCFTEIVFQSQVTCPVDRINIQRFYKIIKTPNGNTLYKPKSVSDCQRLIMRNEPESVRNDIENNWSDYLRKSCLTLNEIIEIMLKTKNLLETFISKKEIVSDKEMNVLYLLIDEFDKKCFLF